MFDLKQSTAINYNVFCHDSNGDAVTGLTDGGFTKRISKNGGSFAAMTVTITEMENGWYSLPISASHSDTAGILTITLTHASAKQVNLQFRINARITDDIPTAADIADDVWDELQADHVTAGTFGVIASEIADILVDTGTTLDGKIDTIDGIVDNILVDTGTTLDSMIDIIDTVVDDILVDTGTTIPATLAILDGLIDDIKAKTDNLPSGIPKNVALNNFMFQMVQSSDHVTAATGLTITGEISQDGGAFAALTNAEAEVSNGWYSIDFTQSEMNADVIALKFTASGADQRDIVLVTDT